MKFLAAAHPLLLWLAGLAVAAMAVPLALAWWRATAPRRAVRRRLTELRARRARAEHWWRQHSLSTVPHSRFLESVLDAASTRPPRTH